MFKKWNLLILIWSIIGYLPLMAQPTFTIQDTPVSCGATTASVDITVANFVEVSGMQFTVSWDETILDYVSFSNLNTNLPALFPSNIGTGFTDDGDLTFAWIDGDLSGEMLDDDEILFTINFDVIGTLPTTIEFTNNVTSILVTGIGSFPPPAIMANFESGVVSIGDNVFPEIECPDPVTVDADAGSNTAVVMDIAPVSFSDDCGTPAITYSTTGATPDLTGEDDISGETFNGGITEITYTATDGGGNETTCVFTVTVNGGTPVEDVTFIAQTNTATCIGDGLSIDITVQNFENITGAQFTISWDENILDYTSFTNLNPDLENLAPTNISEDFVGQGDLTFAWIDLSGEDLDDDAILFTINFEVLDQGVSNITFTDNVTDILVTGENLVVLTPEFISGSGSANDTEAPSIECPDDVSTTVPVGMLTKIIENIAPSSFSDNCGDPAITYMTSGATPGLMGADDISGAEFNLGETVVTYTATDEFGLSSNCSFTITIEEDMEVLTPQFIAEMVEVDCGATTVSVDVSVSNFTNISGAQFTVSWNENALEYLSADNFNSTLNAEGPHGFGTVGIDDGDLSFFWIDNDLAGVSLTPPDTVLFTINFTVLNPPLDTDIDFTDNVTISVVSGIGSIPPPAIAADFISGSVTHVPDTEAPEITCPALITINCGESTAPANTGSATVTDNCNMSITATFSDVEDLSGCASTGTITRTWTADDGNGNTSMCTQIITIADSENPTFDSAPASIADLECGTDLPTQETLTASDNCGTATVVPSVNPFTEDPCNGYSVTYVWTATDECNNSTVTSVTFNVLADDTNPTFDSSPATIADIACGADLPMQETLTATDNCGTATVVPSVDPFTEDPCNGYSITYVWTATDECNNSTVTSVTFNVLADDTNPTFDSSPATIADVACGVDLPTQETLTATDNCGTATVVPSVDPFTEDCNGYSVTYVWTATDECNNSTVTSVTFNVLADDTNPTFDSSPATIADVACGVDLPTQETLTATDNCGTATVVPSVDPFTEDCNGYSVTYVWTATDECDNSTVTSVTFNVLADDTNPTFDSSPATIADIACGADLPTQETLTATDNCGTATVVPSVDPFTEDPCNGYSITYVWTATDECDNSTVTSVTFNVLADDIDPTFDSSPMSISDIECGAALPAQETLTASDNCGAAIVVPSVDPFTVGCDGYAVTYRWTATDDCNNSTVTSVTFNVLPDNINPTFDNSPMAIADIECGASLPTQETLTASDNCGNATVVPSVDPFTEDLCDGYSITYRWTATDECGNSAVTAVTFNVLSDNTNPTFDSSPMAIADLGCGEALPAQETLTASDNCGDATVVASIDPFTEDPCNGYAVTYRWTATDECSNNTVTSVTFNILPDNTNPTFDNSPMAIADIECGTALPVQETLTASDNCGTATVVPSIDPFTEDVCNGYSITYRWTATDDCGNTAVLTESFEVLPDTEGPNFTAPADIVLNCNEDYEDLSITGIVTGESDNCSSIQDVSFVDEESGSTVCNTPSEVIRTWTVTDECGNESTQIQIITLVEEMPPTFTVPPPVTINCQDDPTDLTLTGDVTDEMSFCNPNSPQATFEDEDGATGCHGVIEIIRTWTLDDGCSPVVEKLQVITIVDIEAPTFTAPPAVTIECGESTAVANTGDVTDEDDNCDTTLDATFTDNVSGLTGCGGTGVIVRTWTLTDDCNNSTTHTQTITIQDVTPPVFTPPVAASISCDADITDLTLTGEPTMISDGCDPNPAVTYTDDDSGLTACNGTGDVIRTWTVTDACNNTATATQTISVFDNTPPTFTSPASLTIDCTESYTDLSVTGDVTDEGDNCGTNLMATFTDVLSTDVLPSDTSSCGGPTMVTRTWTLTDDCGNTTTAEQVIVLDDIVPLDPLDFTVPDDITITCEQDSLDLTLTGDVTDETSPCNSSPEATFDDADITYVGCVGTLIRTWTLDDGCSGSVVKEQTITIIDETAPTFIAPAAITVDCSTDVMDPSGTGSPSGIDDNCSATLDPTFSDDDSGLTGCNNTGEIIRTWTVSDECGNTATATQVITVVDETDPTFTVPDDITIFCNVDVTNLPITGDVTDEADNCSSNLEATFEDVETGTTICNTPSQIVRTWTLEDDCGNTVSFDQIITIEDTPDGAVPPPPVTINCEDDPLDLTLTGEVTGDLSSCNPNATATFVDAPVTYVGCVGTLIRTWTIDDGCSPIVEFIQVITIVDNEMPAFTVPANTTISCEDDPLDFGMTGDVTDESDNCSNGLDATFTDNVTGLNGCNGTGQIVRTWTLTDDCGNANTQIQIITVVDNVPPTFTAPTAVTLSCEQDVTDLSLTGEISDEADNCSTIFEATYSDDNSGLTACNGTGQIIRTWSLTDDCGNETTQQQIILIIDITPPTFTVPASIDFNCTLDYTNITLTGDVTDESDNCSVGLDAEFTDMVIGNTSCMDPGQVIRTWTLSDDCGNSVSADQIINLTSDGASFTTPSDTTINCDEDPSDLSLTGDVTDEMSTCNPNPQATYDDDLSGLTGCNGSGVIMRIWTLDDGCSGEITGTQIITIVDETAPVALCQNVTISLSASGMAVVSAEDIDDGSSDNCQDAETLNFALSQTDFDCAHIGDNQVTMTVTDNCGNESTCFATVTVEDNMPPEIDCILSDLTVNTDPGSCVASNVWMPATGSDNCGVPVVTSSHNNNSTFPVGETVVMHTATDGAGNTATCSYIVTVEDNEPPQLSCDLVQIQITLIGNCEAMVNWTGVTASDNCMDDLVVSSTHNPGDVFPLGVTTTVEYMATDASGNTAICSFDVSPVDDVPPTIACPESITLSANGADCSAIYTWNPISISDNCPGVTMTCTAQSGDSFPEGTTTVVCTATDAAGNMSTCSFDVTVEDDEAPVAACYSDVEIRIDGTVLSDPDGIIESAVPNADCSGLIINYTNPEGTDNCTTAVISPDPSHPSGTLFVQGTTPVVFTFSDDAGNSSSCTWAVNVSLFAQAPTITPSSSGLTLCEGEDLQLFGSGFVGTYTWTDPSNNTIVNDTLTLNDISTSGAGLYTLEVTINGSCTVSSEATVIVNAAPDISATSNSPACDGALSLTALEAGGSVPVTTWDWQGACGVSGSTANISFTDLTDDCDGIYTIVATTADGCTSTQEIDVDIVNLPDPNLSMACDQVLCVSESCFLLGTEYPGSLVGYNWAAADNAGLPPIPDQSSLEINPTATGEYTYEYWVDQDGCNSDTASITMSIVDRPILNDDQYVTVYQTTVETADMTNNDVIIDQLADEINVFALPSNGSVSINVDGNYSYTPNDGFIGDDFFLYRICYNCDVSECDTARVDIRVEFTGECEVPNIITPNGDGINDLLEISCLKTGEFPNSEMLIMNQWGDKVFYASPYLNDWDGTLKGKDGKGLPDATYYYIFKETPNSPGDKGYIMIHR